MEQAKRKPGRPPRSASGPETGRIEFRCLPELRRQIHIAAAEEGLAVGAWLKLAAEERLKRQRRREDGSA